MSDGRKPLPNGAASSFAYTVPLRLKDNVAGVDIAGKDVVELNYHLGRRIRIGVDPNQRVGAGLHCPYMTRSESSAKDEGLVASN